MSVPSRNFSLLLSVALLVVGCSHTAGNVQVTPTGVPDDESTSEQHQQIQSVAVEITTIAREAGYKGSFDQIAIIVSSNDSTPYYGGYCSLDANGKGQFIVLGKGNFNGSDEKNVRSTLFMILLHEIGHCYFGRGHDSTLIEKDGRDMGLPFPDKKFVYVHALPATAMSQCGLMDPTGSLRHYYVAEILGASRAKSAEDLLKFADIEFVPQDDSPRRSPEKACKDEVDQSHPEKGSIE